MIGVPERTWRRWQAKARGHSPPTGAVAEADPGRGKGNGRQARRSTHRVGASQGLGDDQA